MPSKYCSRQGSASQIGISHLVGQVFADSIAGFTVILCEGYEYVPMWNAIGAATPVELAGQQFPAGSVGRKVDAACRFVTATGSPAVIGALDDLAALLRGDSGTRISLQASR